MKKENLKKTLFANKKEIILNKYQQLFLIQRKETFGKRKRNLCMDIDDQRPGPTKSGSRASPLPFQAPAYTWSPVLSAFPFFFLVRARSSLNYDTTRAQNPTAVQHVQPDTNLKNCPVNVESSVRLHPPNLSLSFHALSVLVSQSLASDI